MTGTSAPHSNDAEPMPAASSNRYPAFRLNAFLTGLVALLGIVAVVAIPETRSTGFYVAILLLASTAAFNLAVARLAGDDQRIALGSTGAKVMVASLCCLAVAGIAAAVVWSPWAILLTVGAAWDFALLKALARADSDHADH